MENIIAQPLYLWAFQTNREQLKRYFPFRSEKHPIVPIEIYNIIVGNKQRIDLLLKSHLSVILAKKLVSNNDLYQRYSRFQVGRILTQQHYFQDIKCSANLAGHSDWFCFVSFQPTTQFLATGSHNKITKLWRFSDDGSTATLVATLAVHSDSVRFVSINPRAFLLPNGSNDNTVKIWR